MAVRLEKAEELTGPTGGSCAAGSLGDLATVGGEAFLATLAATLNVYRVSAQDRHPRACV